MPKTQFPEYPKDPDAKIVFEFNYVSWLEGEAISTFDVTILPSGELAIEGSAGEGPTGIIAVVLINGDAGRTYRVQCRITTPTRADDRSVKFNVRER